MSQYSEAQAGGEPLQLIPSPDAALVAEAETAIRRAVETLRAFDWEALARAEIGAVLKAQEQEWPISEESHEKRLHRFRRAGRFVRGVSK